MEISFTQKHAYRENSIDATGFAFGIGVSWEGSTRRNHGMRGFAARLGSLLQDSLAPFLLRHVDSE